MVSNENIGSSMPPKSMKELLWEARDKVIAKRKALLEAKEDAIGAKEGVKDHETACVLEGAYTASGKNEKEREAWLRETTANRRDELAISDRAERAAQLELECALDERRCLESILKIEEAA